MRLVSPLLKRAVYPALHYSGVLGHITPLNHYAVVNYHGVVPSDHSIRERFLDGNLVQPKVFRQQLQFLKSHYNVIHPEDFRAWVEQGRRPLARSVLLTCDDGLLNALTEMVPILRSEGVSCLFFVTSSSCSDHPGMLWYEELYLLMRNRPLTATDLQLVDEEAAKSHSRESFQAQWWNTVKRASRLDAGTRAEWVDRVRNHCGSVQQSLPERRWRLMNIAELKQLTEQGMSIGAHTRTHPILSLCSVDEARREILESRGGI